jgi:TonB-like protein
MTSKWSFLLLLPACLVVSALAAGPPHTPQQMLDLSRTASDLSEAGPYQLQATVVLNPGTSKEIAGQISILRDKGLYRSEIKLRDYREVRRIKNNMLYIARTQPVPVPKTVLLRQLDRLWRANLPVDDTQAAKVLTEKDHGKILECFEISRGESTRRRLCFDPSTSVLVKAKSFESHDVEFRDFSTFEQKYFPQRIIFRERDRMAMEVRDITISKATFAADVFDPPAGATGLPTCDEPTPPRKIQDAVPKIPVNELRTMRSASVYLYGLVTANGSVQNVAVQYSPHASFTESALDAFKQWRYAPAMCGDKAIPAEIEQYFLFFVQ